MNRALAALVLTAAFSAVSAPPVHGDAAADAEFRAAVQLAATRDPRALDAFEALGRARPASRWTDDAWVEAARLAERAGDFDRARRDLGEAIAIGEQLGDAQLVRRARGDLARLAAISGGAGEWSAVAAEHQQLVSRASGGGDPTPALEALEALARAHPAYPRGVAIRIALARGWEQEDQLDRALDWLHDAIRIAAGEERDRARIALIRTLLRVRELAPARRELAQLDDRLARASLARDLATAERRMTVRRIVGGVLALVLVLALVRLRARTGGWGATARAIGKPPIEVLYVVPISAVISAIALTGNPLVGKAVVSILAAGVAIAWLSGVQLEAGRGRGALGSWRAIGHAVVVTIAVLACVYLILDHAGLIDLVLETWRTGPSSR